MEVKQKYSVLLIRSVSDETSGSCCSGAGASEGVEGISADSFKNIYSYLKDNKSDNFEFDLLDPRNAFIAFILIKDCARFKVPFKESLKTLFTYSVPSIVINGKVVFKTIPTIEDFKFYIDSLGSS